MRAKLVLASFFLSSLLVGARYAPDYQRDVEYYEEGYAYSPVARREVSGLGPKQLNDYEDVYDDSEEESIDPETCDYIYSRSIVGRAPYNYIPDEDDSTYEHDLDDLDEETFSNYVRRTIDDLYRSYGSGYPLRSGLVDRDDHIYDPLHDTDSLTDKDYEELLSDLERRGFSLGSLGSGLSNGLGGLGKGLGKGLGSITKKKPPVPSEPKVSAPKVSSPKISAPKISNPFSSKKKVQEISGSGSDGKPVFPNNAPKNPLSGSGGSSGGKGKKGVQEIAGKHPDGSPKFPGDKSKPAKPAGGSGSGSGGSQPKSKKQKAQPASGGSGSDGNDHGGGPAAPAGGGGSEGGSGNGAGSAGSGRGRQPSYDDGHQAIPDPNPNVLKPNKDGGYGPGGTHIGHGKNPDGSTYKDVKKRALRIRDDSVWLEVVQEAIKRREARMLQE